MQNSMISVNFLNRNTVKWDFFTNVVVAVDGIISECICNVWSECKFFLKWMRKRNWNRNRKKKPKVKPCQHQLTKDIFVDSCCVFFLLFLFECRLSDGLFLCNRKCAVRNCVSYMHCNVCGTMCMSVSFVLKFTSLMDNNGIDSIFKLLKPFSQWTTDKHIRNNAYYYM